MKIFPEFRKKNIETKKVQAVGGQISSAKSDIKLAPFSLDQAPKRKANQYMGEMKNWLYPNITAIADPLSAIEFHLYKYVSKGKKETVEEVNQHEVLDLLNNPNNFMTKEKLIYTYSCHRSLQGEASWLIIRKNGEAGVPTEIFPLRPDWITVKVGDLAKDEFVKAFIYKIDGNEVAIPPTNMLFFTDPNPENPFRGLGKIEAGSTIIDIDNFAREWNRNLMFNNGNIGGVFSTEGRLDEDILKRIKDQIRKEYTGIQNAGKFLFLEGGLKLEGTNASPKELDFNVGRERSRDEISSLFKNPKTKLGITDDVNRANAEATEYVHNKDVIKVEMNKLVSELNEFLLPMFNGTDNMFLSFTDPVPENAELKYKKMELVNKIYTVNELRTEEGLEEVDGGDVLYFPINLAPIGEGQNASSGTQKEMQIAMKVINKLSKGEKLTKVYSKEVSRIKNKDFLKRKKQQEIKATLKQALALMITQKQPTMEKIKVRTKTITKSVESLGMRFQKVLHKLNEAYEKKIITILGLKWYSVIEKEVLANINKLDLKKDYNKKAVAELFSEERAVQLGIDLLTPIMLSLGEDAGKQAISLIGLGDVFEMHDELKKQIVEDTRKFSTVMTQTASDRVRSVVQDGVEQGHGIVDIRNSVKQEFANLKDYQAERIARTEIARSSNISTIDAWKQSKVVEGKEWVLDGKPCDACIGAEKNFKGGIKLDDHFYKEGESDSAGRVLSYGNVDSPPLHANCMCSLQPVFVLNKRITEKVELKDEEIIDKAIEILDAQEKT